MDHRQKGSHRLGRQPESAARHHPAEPGARGERAWRRRCSSPRAGRCRAGASRGRSPRGRRASEGSCRRCCLRSSTAAYTDGQPAASAARRNAKNTRHVSRKQRGDGGLGNRSALSTGGCVRAALTDVVRADLLRLLAQQQLALHRDLEVIIRRVGRDVRVGGEVAGLVQLVVQLL